MVDVIMQHKRKWLEQTFATRGRTEKHSELKSVHIDFNPGNGVCKQYHASYASRLCNYRSTMPETSLCAVPEGYRAW